MNFKNYTHFKNYCLKIAKNKEYIVCKEYLQLFEEFELVVHLLNELEDMNIVKSQKNIQDIIVNNFKKENFEPVFSVMKYSIDELYRFLKEERDFYYVTIALNRMIHLDLEFNENFILNPASTKSRFYPCKVNTLLTKFAEEKVYTISKIDFSYKGKYGVYFIYNDEDELVYIGKSCSCLLARSFESARERNCLNFSKIELRECKSKSDVAIYEAYYISLYKPRFNSDMVFDDAPAVKLKELPISKSIVRDVDSEYFTYTYTYYVERVMNTTEFINLATNNHALLYTAGNVDLLKNNNIYTKYEAQQKAYEDYTAKVKRKETCINVSKLGFELAISK